jgi:hypothetical protein
MAFEGQIDRLIEKLTELTRSNKMAWQETVDDQTFLTGVGKTVVTVGRAGSDSFSSCFIRVLDETGKTIDEAYGSVRTSTQDFERLNALVEVARRSALKSDQVVTELLSTLEAIR